MGEPSYQERVEAQIAQYSKTVNMHDLPEIFHVWSQNYILPGLKQVFGVSSIDEAYAVAYIEARERAEGPGRILSIGCGDGAVEIRVANILLQRGVDDFVFVGADLSPILLGHLERAASDAGLSAYFQPVEADLNQIEVAGEFDVIMANHSLHHIAGLEELFRYSRERLKPGGIFATCDMIGRNGHQRWAEAAAVLQALWPLLEPKQRYNTLLQKYHERFVDHDCSTKGFEGIRAQDILPIMLQEFHPYKFFGAGGAVDILVDRGYGPGFDIHNQRDVDFIKCAANLNEILLDSGLLKPTWMLAYITVDDRGEIFYRDRRAIHCVRNRDGDPAWTRFYGSPAVG